MTWRLAAALTRLRQQVNRKWPNRMKDSDGSIGNEEHAARSSDHNPWIQDHGVGIVSAIDLTHDPHSGFDSYAFAEMLREMQDPRIKYIISNRRICSSEQSPWEWRPYHGTNPHDHHVHISVKSDKVYYDDTREWKLRDFRVSPVEMGKPIPMKTIKLGSDGLEVERLQTALYLQVDGDFGLQTKEAVQKFQRQHKIVDDGIVGPQTWGLILKPGELA
jgi:hypothetical protein